MKKQYFVYFLILFCSQLQALQQLTKVEYFVGVGPDHQILTMVILSSCFLVAQHQ